MQPLLQAMNHKKELGRRIRAERVASEMSTFELAIAAGVLRSTIDRLERGVATQGLRVDTLARIAHALGVPAQRLIGDGCAGDASALAGTGVSFEEFALLCEDPEAAGVRIALIDRLRRSSFS